MLGILYIIFIPLRKSYWQVCKILSAAPLRMSFYILLMGVLSGGFYLPYLIRSTNFLFLLDFPKVFTALNAKQTSWYISKLNDHKCIYRLSAALERH